MEKDLLKRVEKLEKDVQQLQNATMGKVDSVFGSNRPVFDEKTRATIIDPHSMPVGYIGYLGNYVSDDGRTRSVFGCDMCKIDNLLQQDSVELANILTAFASEERINIIKSLLQKQKRAKDLMEELKFATTGKLYHHLSFLEKTGCVRKDGEVYHISAKNASCVLLIFAAMGCILK